MSEEICREMYAIHTATHVASTYMYVQGVYAAEKAGPYRGHTWMIVNTLYSYHNTLCKYILIVSRKLHNKVHSSCTIIKAKSPHPGQIECEGH